MGGGEKVSQNVIVHVEQRNLRAVTTTVLVGGVDRMLGI